jgi:predicted patatin/cPLA2 family phospholipase
MHPVIQHILDRKNKEVPINDGRKIALFLPGGVMAGVRGAGAMIALEELGLHKSFDDIFATSAGFPNAAYLLAGDIKLGTSIYYEDLCSKEFINLSRVWNIINIDFVLNVFKSKKPLNYKKISESTTRLHVRLLNLGTGKTGYKLLNGLPSEEIEHVMHAAISVPYLNPGSIELENAKFKDPGLTKGDLEAEALEILSLGFTDVLIIYNYPEQYYEARSAGILDSDNFYQIIPYAEDKLSRICTDPTILMKAAENMGSQVKSIFGDDTPITLK